MDFLIIIGAGEVKMMTFLTGNGHNLDLFLPCHPSFPVFHSVPNYSTRVGLQERCSTRSAQMYLCPVVDTIGAKDLFRKISSCDFCISLGKCKMRTKWRGELTFMYIPHPILYWRSQRVLRKNSASCRPIWVWNKFLWAGQQVSLGRIPSSS